MTAPATVPDVFRRAAEILTANGLWQQDYVPDPFDREMCLPHFLRPMSIVAALRCAVTGDPHRTSLLADEATDVLALRIDGGPEYGDIFSLESHVDGWGDASGRSAADAAALLLGEAGAVEQLAARSVLEPSALILADGTVLVPAVAS